MVTKTPLELAELSPEQRRQYVREEEASVFGPNPLRDRDGRPIEQGVGSASQPTHNHVAALKRWYDGPDRDEVIAAAEAALNRYEDCRRRGVPYVPEK